MNSEQSRPNEEGGDLRIILLATQPRMLREMLHRALEETPEVQLVLEMDDPDRISSLLDRLQADWLVTTLNEEDRLPSYIRAAMKRHPSISVIGLAADGSHARVTEGIGTNGSLERENFAMDNFSLADLLQVVSESDTNRH